jgi:Zn-dependent metalloprotease
MSSHHSHCFIVPPHIIRALAENKEKRIRDIGLRTLAFSAKVRGRREILSRVLLGKGTGQMHRTIYDAEHGTTLPGKMVWDEGDKESSEDSVKESCIGLEATYKLYAEIYKRNSIDDHGLRLDASVHYSQDFDNAFWDGQQMVFGDGDNIIFVGFTKSIDVIGHELTHGVTQYTAGLKYEGQSGALNESFSDVFGSLVKQYYLGEDAHSADWLIGEGILAPGIHGKALRSMKDPGSAYDDPKLGGKDPQPGDMSGYVQDGDVHINSGIPNHAFYLLADQLGGNAWDDSGHIWYETLKRLWAGAEFQDCANVSYSVAGELFGVASTQQKAVLTAWDEVGIKVQMLRRPKREKVRERVGANGALAKKRLKEIIEGLQDLVGTMD